MPMKKPNHPGDLIRDCLDELQISVTDGAKALGVTRTTLSRLLNAKASVSPEMALRLLNVARSGTEVTVKGPQNLHGRLAVKRPQIGASLRRPINSHFGHGLASAAREAKFAKDVFVRNALTTVERSARLVKRGGFLRGDGLLFHRGRSQ